MFSQSPWHLFFCLCCPGSELLVCKLHISHTHTPRTHSLSYTLYAASHREEWEQNIHMRVLSVPPHCQFKASGMELAEYFHIHALVDYTLCIKGCIKVHSLPVSILDLAPVIPRTLLSLSGVFWGRLAPVIFVAFQSDYKKNLTPPISFNNPPFPPLSIMQKSADPLLF